MEHNSENNFNWATIYLNEISKLRRYKCNLITADYLYIADRLSEVEVRINEIKSRK